MVDNTYAQYAVRIQGQIMLHSVPYTSPESDALEYWEYNKLGNVASLGCVRFQVADIKWIYDNCPEGTKVKIYSKVNEEPVLPLPEMQKLNESDPRSSWDPSDPDENNPWNTDSKTLKRNVKRRKKKQKQQLLTATQTAKKKQLAEKQSVVKQQQNQAIQTTKQQQRKTQNQRQLKKLRKKKTQQRKTIQKKQPRKILQKRRLKNKLRRKQKK